MIKYLGTEEIEVDALAPFPGNAWHGDVDKIAESVARNGQYRSIVVRRTPEGDVVLAGNHTRLAVKQLGQGAIRCEVIECDAETATRINLADNKLPTYGAYDEGELLALLESLDDGFEATGYTADDLDDLVAALRPEAQVLPEVGPTDARYAETPEEEAARRDRIESYEPRHSGTDGAGAMTELILVMTVEQRQEAGRLIASIRGRDGDDLTAGAVVLYALRSHAGETGEETGDEENDD
jgi:ParB-like nuclease family protein